MNTTPNACKTIALERYLRRVAVRWAMLGSSVTLFLAVPSILYSAKVSSERQLLVAAKSAARAFRPMILQDDIRDVEYQMQKALELKPGESATIRDPNLNAIYPLQEGNKILQCSSSSRYCWGQGFRTISLLYPIYFDEQKKQSLYGYLELTLHPTLDGSALLVFVALLIAAFTGQAFGLASALSQASRKIVDQLSCWADYLKSNACVRPTDPAVLPFSELLTMQEAVDGLYTEIEKLRAKTAKEAKSEAQFTLLREISHDLKTPHSLLAKYFAVHLNTVQNTGQCSPIEVTRIERTLKRMGDLLRQVCGVSFNRILAQDSHHRLSNQANQAEGTCQLGIEMTSILDDFRHDPEVEEKQIGIEFTSAKDLSYEAQISRTAFYRISENLLRNAIEALGPIGGRILVLLDVVDGSPVLSIKDNGSGIKPEIQERIFDFDFTTKPTRGTGLGLGIIEKICKEFGATLHFSSELGVGTEFVILFQPSLLQPSFGIGVTGNSTEVLDVKV